MNRRNLELVFRYNERRHYPLADDKLWAKTRLAGAGVPVPETLATCEGLFAIPSLLAAVRDQEDFVIKPANGSGGDGILVLGAKRGPGVWERIGGDVITEAEIQRHLANVVFGAFSKHLEDKAFVEKRIFPHHVYEGFWAQALCDVRILTVEGRPFRAMVRVPSERSLGRANLHQGGIGVAVDLESGRTTRALRFGESIERHPDSDNLLVGVQLPCWPEVLEASRRAAASVPLGYLGVDLVVDRDLGPLVLEINARPGLEIQNVHGAGLGVDLPEGKA